MRLPVGDGHELYWERAGTPGGKPVVVLHGGPGQGATPGMRRFLDPARYELFLFDQRGCGRSTPNAADTLAALEHNTTRDLVADIERLRKEVGVDRWLVAGGSWGTTLALAYAQVYPERVTEMVLVAIGSTSRAYVEFITRGVGPQFPEAWARFRDFVPAAERDGNLAAAYARLLASPDPEAVDRAALEWCTWEDTHMQIPEAVGLRAEPPEFRRCFARLVTHYWSHAAWLDEDELLQGVDRLAHIPAALIHGQGDVSTPADFAEALAARWPAAELLLVDEGHTGGPETAAAIAAAGARFA